MCALTEPNGLSIDCDVVLLYHERTDNDLKKGTPCARGKRCSLSVLFHLLYPVIHPLCFPAVIAHEQIPDDKSYR